MKTLLENVENHEIDGSVSRVTHLYPYFMQDSHSRPYDVVLYGASSFAGQQAVFYFSKSASVEKSGLRWALGGGSAMPIDALARSTKVVLCTQGPFAMGSRELVDACVRHGTHYVDSSYQTEWTRSLVDPFHHLANRKGVRIVPFCGLDSVPSDLSVFMAQAEMQARFGEPCVHVQAAFDVVPVHTPVVQRSGVLLNYGDGFRYEEFLKLGEGRFAAAAAFGVTAGSFVLRTALGWPFLQPLTRRLAPYGVQDLSRFRLSSMGFQCQWVGTSAHGNTVRGHISESANPSTSATTKIACESALALALQLDELPNGPRYGGVLTPASALGDVLVRRLRATGMILKVDPGQGRACHEPRASR